MSYVYATLTSTFFHRILVLLISFGLIFGGMPYALANQDAMIQELQDSVAALGNTIASSPDLTPSERALLLQQFLELSAATLTLPVSSTGQTALLRPRAARQSDPTPLRTAAAEQRIAEAGISHIVIQAQHRNLRPGENATAETEIFYTDDREVLQMAIDISDVQSHNGTNTFAFAAEVEDQVVNELAGQLDLSPSDLKLTTMLSIDRSTQASLRQRAVTLDDTGFGLLSIIDKIVVYPHYNGRTKIQLLTDQGETLQAYVNNITTQGEGDVRTSRTSMNNRYSAGFTVRQGGMIANRQDGIISYSESETNISYQELIEGLAEELDDFPAVAEQESRKQKDDMADSVAGEIVDFLVRNPASVSTGMRAPPDYVKLNCYEDEDTQLLEEILTYLWDDNFQIKPEALKEPVYMTRVNNVGYGSLRTCSRRSF